MRESTAAAKLIDRIENASALDGLGEALHNVVSRVVRPGPVQDTLSGVPLGHPAHPALVAIPMGAWSSAVLCDVVGEHDSARRLVGFGVLSAVPTAATGASDWLSTAGAERRVGLVHALLNYAAIGAFAGSWLARRTRRIGAGVGMSGLGMALVSAAGWLGGHLTYAQGVGVDTTAFQHLPDEWTDLVGVADLPERGTLGHAEVGGVPLLLARVDGDVVVMADRCTHRGAPLHEGSLEDDVIRCPWHDSTFCVADGTVRRGPATRPQVVLQTRVVGDMVQVRREESRALRTNPVGH